MKKFCLILTLLLANISAANFEVKVIYFQPTNSQDRAEWLDLDAIMKSIQDTYQSEMERHGFRGKIFRLETTHNGQVIVHKVKGTHNKAHYSGDTLPIVKEELERKGYNDRQSVYVVVMAGMDVLWNNFAAGIASTRPVGGWRGNSEYYAYCLSVETRGRDYIEGVIRHELGHAFGLQHITLYDGNDWIMGSGDRLAFHEARWLSRNHYFNNAWNHNVAPDLEEFHGVEVLDNGKIKFSATVLDESSIFQAYGFVNTAIIGWNFFDPAFFEFGVRAKIDFIDIDREHLNDNKIYFQFMDADGNWTYHNPKTYTLPERPIDNKTVDSKQFPDCILCDLDRFADHLKNIDVDGNGLVNIADLDIVISNLGKDIEEDTDPNPDVNRDGVVTQVDVDLIIKQLNAAAAPMTPKVPEQTQLLSNYPNPFNPETWIPYQLATPADVTIRIYTANGVLVRTLTLGHQPAGIYQHRSRAAYWDGRNYVGEPVASGVYFYTLTAGDFTATRKVLVWK